MIWDALFWTVVVLAIAFRPCIVAKARLIEELAREKEIENDRKEADFLDE